VVGLLGRVRALYAPSEVDRGWFLEHGRLTTAQAKAVTTTVNELCQQLRPYADTLVDGLGIPDAWLDAVILRD